MGGDDGVELKGRTAEKDDPLFAAAVAAEFETHEPATAERIRLDYFDVLLLPVGQPKDIVDAVYFGHGSRARIVGRGKTHTPFRWSVSC